MTDPDNANVTYCPECALREATYPDHPAEPRQGLLTAEEVAGLSRGHYPSRWDNDHCEAPECRWQKWPCVTTRLLASHTALEAQLAEAQREWLGWQDKWNETAHALATEQAARREAERERDAEREIRAIQDHRCLNLQAEINQLRAELASRPSVTFSEGTNA